MNHHKLYVLRNPCLADNILKICTIQDNEIEFIDSKYESGNLPTPFEIVFDIPIPADEVVQDGFKNAISPYRFGHGDGFYKIAIEQLNRLIEEFLPNSGYIYIMSNPSYKGLLKIGYSKDPEERAKSLSGTALPTPFEMERSWCVFTPEECEAVIHEKLGKHRCNPDREFFRIPLQEAINVINAVCGKETHYHLSDTEEKVQKESMGPTVETSFKQENTDRASHLFSVGLGYERSGNLHESTELFRRAANLGYGPAINYLTQKGYSL